jgi:peptidoglycan hydrolase CwlO-like protein
MVDFSKYYRSYRYMQDLLKSDFTHNYIEEALKDGDEGKDSISGKTNEKVIDMDWVIAIEETLPYIQKAIDEQESFAVYENRVLLTLIHKALMFVDDKYAKMKDVPNDSYNNITVNRHLELNQQKLAFSVNYVNENHESLAENLDVEDIESLSDFDRIRRIRQGLNECLATPLMKEVAKEPQVKPPLTQTNLLKENPNFKKAVELWNFLDTYKKQGFEIVGEEYNGKMTDENKEDVYLAMEFQHFMMSITTNPALRKMLQEKYEEENVLAKEESDRPEKVKGMVLEAQIEAVRKEETEIRLKEIREREKQILDLNSEIKSLKITLDQKEQQILTLKGQISALQDELDNTKNELKETKLKLLEAQKEIERLKEETEKLTAEITELKETLENERVSHAKQVEQMNADFAEKTRIAEENFANQLSAKQKEFDDAQTAHNEYVTKLNTDNANKIAELNTNHSNEVAQLKSNYENRIDTINKENATATANLKSDYEGQLTSMKADYTSQIKNYEKQIADINAENAKNVKELNDNHAKEIKTITKESEKRMADFEKETTKKMNDTIADVKKKAKDEVRQAEKTAKEKIAEAKGENKLFKKKKEVFEAAYAAGSVGLMAMLAEKYASEGRTDFADHLVSATAAIRAIMIAPTPKGLTLTMYTHGSAKLLKLYAGVTRYDVAIADTVSSFGGVEGQPVFISFAGVEGEVANEIAAKIKETADCKVTVSQNRRIQSTGIIGIYFCGE